MVDNKENQWEDTEYIEDEEVLDDEAVEDDGVEEYEEDDTESYEDDDASGEEDGEEYEEYEDGDEEYEEYDEEGEETPQKKKMLIPLIVVLLLLLAGTGFGISKFMSNKNSNTANNSNYSQPAAQVNNQENAGNQNTEELAGDFFEQAGGEETDNMMSVNFSENGEETNVMPEANQGESQNQGGEEQVATVTEPQPGEGVTESDLFENQSNEENDSIMVTYNKAARINPFKPPVIEKSNVIPYETINNSQFEIIEPPTAAVPDENLTKLLQTQISGIMYDSESPSAIVNLNGQDQFVKIGDVIAGYKINNITKDKVQITYKNNSYVASVGELFTRGALEKQPAVANLEDKFAGRHKKINNN